MTCALCSRPAIYALRGWWEGGDTDGPATACGRHLTRAVSRMLAEDDTAKVEITAVRA